MATKKDEIKIKITNYKRKITNFVKFIDVYNVERDFPPLEKRIKNIETEFDLFNKCYTELEILVADPTHAKSRTEHEEKFYYAFGKATSPLKEYSSNQGANSSSAQESEHETRSNFVRNTKKLL